MESSSSDNGNVRDWSHLPSNTLDIIGKKLHSSVADVLRFSSVCSSWHDATLGFRQPPWLMLPHPVCPSDLHTRQFFLLSSPSLSSPPSSSSALPCSPSALANNRYFHLHLVELVGKVYHGLNHAGWLLVIESGCKMSPYLFNPITNSRFFLPPLPLPTIWNQCRSHKPHNDVDIRPPNYVDYDNHKFLGPDSYMPYVSLAVLSSAPESNNGSTNNYFELMVIFGWDMSLLSYRCGDDKWTAMQTRDSEKSYSSLAYYNGQFYAINEYDLVVCNTHDDEAASLTAMATEVVLALPKSNWREKIIRFLVTSDQDLLLVIRDKVEEGFKVFKLNEGQWLRMNSVGERAIFICQDNCFTISTAGLVDCCRPNCIYYFDLSMEKIHLAESSIKLIEFCIPENKMTREINASPPSRYCWWRSLWFQPSSD